MQILKSAERHLDAYIGNCDLGITVDIVKDFIFNKTGVAAVKCEQLKVNNFSKSFKITTLAHEREKLLDRNIWPQGIICKKFYKPNANKKSSRIIYNKNIKS